MYRKADFVFEAEAADDGISVVVSIDTGQTYRPDDGYVALGTLHFRYLDEWEQFKRDLALNDEREEGTDA